MTADDIVAQHGLPEASTEDGPFAKSSGWAYHVAAHGSWFGEQALAWQSRQTCCVTDDYIIALV
ncbi:hypothetical protein [Nocardia australiensis]|uniref:hypothetical protein n=1 Tax=Nocardia australiensis TaxID=2887191 RepID=UPI001D13DC41|nr:hypothetical protein [Nocardia australiensis]